MEKLTVYYSVRNGGDGSAYPIFMESNELAEWDQEHQSEGWGESCTGSITFESESQMFCKDSIDTKKDYLFDKYVNKWTDISDEAIEFVETFFPYGLPFFDKKLEDEYKEKLEILRGKAEVNLINFKLTDKNTGGTSLKGYINFSYDDLVDVFGEPNCNGDEHKVSTEWILEDSEGNIVTIYDWKATNLYDSDYPSVEKFRKIPYYDWHVGGLIDRSSELQYYVERKLDELE